MTGPGGSWTGSPTRVSSGGRSCRSVRPIASGPPTRRHRRSRAAPHGSTIVGHRSVQTRSRHSSRPIRSGRVPGRHTPDPVRSPTRSGSTASGTDCVRTPPTAACASSATWRSRSLPKAPTTWDSPSSSSPGWRRRTARRLERRRTALGHTRVRLGGDPHRRLPVVDRAIPTCGRARRRGAHRPLPWLRRRVRDPRPRPHREVGHMGPRPGSGGVRRRRGQSRGGPGRGREPRTHHAAGGTTADDPRVSGHGGAPLLLRRLDGELTEDARSSRTPSSTPAPTTTTHRWDGGPEHRHASDRGSNRPCASTDTTMPSRTGC